MSLKIGDRAPEFNLFNSDKEEVSLQAQLGQPCLVLFFPLAYTGVCTEELCTMRDDIASYEALSTKVMAISVDTLFVLEKFKESLNVQFDLLSDFNKEASRAYDCLHESFAFGMKGVSKRSAFVIDKEGIIRYIEILDNPMEVPNFDAIKETLNNL